MDSKSFLATLAVLVLLSIPVQAQSNPFSSPIGNADSLPQDLDGDGLYEDTNGDGEFDTGSIQSGEYPPSDVRTLVFALADIESSDRSQEEKQALDFDGNEDLNSFDAHALRYIRSGGYDREDVGFTPEERGRESVKQNFIMDIDGDGLINFKDVQVYHIKYRDVGDFQTSSSSNYYPYDYNCDGTLNEKDAEKFFKYVNINRDIKIGPCDYDGDGVPIYNEDPGAGDPELWAEVEGQQLTMNAEYTPIEPGYSWNPEKIKKGENVVEIAFYLEKTDSGQGEPERKSTSETVELESGEYRVISWIFVDGEKVKSHESTVTIEKPPEALEGKPAIGLSEDTVQQGESIDIDYSVPRGSSKSYSLSIKNPAGEKVKKKMFRKQGGMTYQVPEEAETGEYQVRVKEHREGVFSSIIGLLTGKVTEKTFMVKKSVNTWKNYCSKRDYNPGSISDQISCIEKEIVPNCFKSQPSQKCRNVASDLCNDLLDYSFDPETGRCVG